MNNHRGKKFDGGKDDWSLLPFESIQEVVKVLSAGAEKYEPENWRLVPNGESRYFSAGMRHICEFKQGRFIDPESGLPHLTHAICNLIFLNELIREKKS